jgi:23S rRNA (cytosine1962-C5)-methyltransferase
VQSIRVSRKAADRLASGHPWVFSSDILSRGQAQPGDIVRVVDQKGRALGVAHYSSTSQIVLRLLERSQAPVDAAFYRRRLEQAAQFRSRHVHDTDAYRLVHAEADLLPGLIVDRYGDCLVVQTLTQGMEHAQPLIARALQDLFAPQGILARNDVAVRKKEDLPLETKVLAGDVPERVSLRMNGLAWRANLIAGQKTGVYLDQRENYLAARHAAARSGAGRRVLDCFTSTGGFALHLASVCERVEAVDSSADALSAAAGNRDANGIANVDFREADVFELLAGYNSARRAFDIVVLDPPAFAKSRASVPKALEAYRELNLRALRLLGSGGILVTCSCSHHVHEGPFLGAIASAAAEASRMVRILERRTQSADHPVLLAVPETQYLKCVVCEVL